MQRRQLFPSGIQTMAETLLVLVLQKAGMVFMRYDDYEGKKIVVYSVQH